MLWKLTFHSVKPVKKAQVTPMSQINDLEVIISELEVCLEEAEEKLAMFTKPTLCIGQDTDLTALLKLEEERERQQQNMERQEFLKAQKEQEAWRYELWSMLNIITQLWERSRSLVSQETASPVPIPMSTHVTPTLLMVVKLPDAPPTTSLSPADILDHQQPLTQFGELRREKEGLPVPTLTSPHVTPTIPTVVKLPDAPLMTSLSPAEILDHQLPPTQFGELDASICDASEEGALPTIKDFNMRDVMDLWSDLEIDSLEEVVGNSADRHGAKQMEAIIALVNALSEARIGAPSADEIMVNIPTFATPESVQVPQHFAKEEDKMVMDSHKKFPEYNSLPAIPVMPMAQE